MNDFNTCVCDACFWILLVFKDITSEWFHHLLSCFTMPSAKEQPKPVPSFSTFMVCEATPNPLKTLVNSTDLKTSS